ncbi:MAG: cytochrome c oxidase accessory protein CcoG [Tagaea sp.]|nr:cytochrome c oxidase accessory protein CcoG [Tagaea sp.]
MDGGTIETQARDVAIHDARSIAVQKKELPLYVDRIKVHPKDVRGAFRRIKWAVLAFCLSVYYVAPFLRWDRGPTAPDQAILIDLPGRKAYFFMIEIWPQEVYFLTGLLILAAIGLFLITSLFGRLWCGYACPQTVWTDLFMWVERKIEGDRNARLKLDAAPYTAGKIAKRAAKHAAWLAIALATGGAWVLYFADAPTTLREIFAGEASFTQYFFVGLFATTTYVLAGLAREQVCTYMCPWPRFQSAMLDDQSYVVTYESWRGEKRGKLAKAAPGIDPWLGRGDCVDCNACVASCPTGIDIRDGQQLECIGCGLCIDACDAVMDKVGRPRGLIRFDTLANQSCRAEGKPAHHKFIRPRTLIYAGVLAVVGTVMLAALMLRTTVELNVLRDRAPLFVTLSDGQIRNAYTIHVLNKTHEARDFALTVSGLAGATLGVAGSDAAAGPSARLAAKPDSVASYRVFVTVPAETVAARASSPVRFDLRLENGPDSARYDSVFLAPGK